MYRPGCEVANEETLEGLILTHIDIDEKNDEILLTTECGRQFLFFHEQECCEHVAIQGADGDWNSLKNRKLISVKHEEDHLGYVDFESTTATRLTFRTDCSTVISRWIGTSNGYYSESVSFAEVIES